MVKMRRVVPFLNVIQSALSLARVSGLLYDVKPTDPLPFIAVGSRAC